MKIEIIKDADYRVKPAITQAFRAGSIVNVPKKTAQALIARGSAIPSKSESED